MKESDVFVFRIEDGVYYPNNPPFHPNRSYPEYPFEETSKKKNKVYDSIRDLLILMECDVENKNTENWNPFKDFVSPNDFVLIKPNLVIDNRNRQNNTTTHPSVIRAILDYVIIALNGKGKIIIGDASLQQCNFNALNKETGLTEVINYIKSKNIEIDLIDFRTEKMQTNQIYCDGISHNNFVMKKLFKPKNYKVKKLKGDPLGYTLVDLKGNSNLYEISKNGGFKNFRVTNYDPVIMEDAHNLINHKYIITNSVLNADVVIHIPKIKSHRKAGITGCLKNNIGINGHKDWLPHHRKGSIFEGGDEYLCKIKIKNFYTFLHEINDIILIRSPKLHHLLFYPLYLMRGTVYLILKLLGRNLYLEGSWYGNDTLWRTIGDLNQILLYADKNGKLKPKIQRKLFYFIFVKSFQFFIKS